MTKYHKLLRLIGVVATVLAALFFLRSLWPYRSQLRALFGQQESLTAVAGALGIYLAIHAVMGCAWGWLLRAAGLYLPWRRCLTIFSLAQMAKYIPGNFMQHISRVGLAREAGLPAGKVIATAFWELSVVLFAGSVLSLLAIETLPGELMTVLGHDVSRKLTLVVLACLLLLGGSWPFLYWLRQRGTADSRANHLTSILFGCCLAYCGVFVLHGWSLNWIGQAMGAPDDLVLCVGTYTLAWIAGFVTPGAVGGIGVREAVLLAGLTPACGPEKAAILAASMRIVSLIGDAVAFLAALLFRKLDPPREPSQANANTFPRGA